MIGSGVPAQYVRLTGYGGNNAVNVQNLKTAREACVKLNHDLGKPSQELNAGGYPEQATVIEIEIYYSVNRTLDVFQSVHHSIDISTCGLTATKASTLTLRSGAGKCDVDLVKKVARGNCDAQAHANAAAWKGDISRQIPVVNMDKVPPNMRDQVLATLQQLQKPDPQSATPKGLSRLANGTKTILDTTCQIYRHEQLDHEVCVAALNPNDKTLNPYPIPASPLNAAIPGVLLESKSAALTITAQQVRWNLSVSPGLFSLPPGVTARNQPDVKP